MSGLCGWIGHGASAADNQVLIEAMAVPLAVFDKTDISTLQASRSAVAVAARAASSHAWQGDGLLVAVWGEPELDDGADAQGQQDGLGERVARLWRRDPDAVCVKLSGAFALAILDNANGDALLAIDRMGTHQLSYQTVGEALVFATSSDALIRHPLTPGAIDPQGLYNYVYFHMVPAPGTVYRGQQRLLPGECLRFRQGRVDKRAYWRMVFDEQPQHSFEDLKQQFRDLLRSSVRDAAGKQPYGAFLSGRHRQLHHRRHHARNKRPAGQHLFDRLRGRRLR